jgi:hypothetical protein
MTIRIYFMKVREFFNSLEYQQRICSIFLEKNYIFNCLIKISSQIKLNKNLVKFGEIWITYFVELLYFIENSTP